MTNKGGRPTICTPELTEEFTNLMAAGNYFIVVCDYLGINKSQAYDWLNFGEAGIEAAGPDPEAYIKFYDSVTRAERLAEIRAVANLQNAGVPHEMPRHLRNDDGSIKAGVIHGDYRAILEFLKRRHPERWADRPKQQVEISGPEGGKIELDVNSYIDLSGPAALAVVKFHNEQEAENESET